MRSAISRASLARAASLLLLAAAPATAQRVSTTTRATSLQLTPYAGYMISGKALEGPLGTSLSNAGGAMFGAQLALKIAPGLAVVGNLGYSDPDVRAGVPFFGDVSVGSSTIWLYDGGLQLSLPNRGGLVPITPFVQGGVGAMRYEVSAGPLSTKATNVAWNVGGGVDVALGRTLGVRLFAKDYIGRFNFEDAAGLDVTGEVTHNVALGLGLRLEF